jgi:hypothetical protein
VIDNLYNFYILEGTGANFLIQALFSVRQEPRTAKKSGNMSGTLNTIGRQVKVTDDDLSIGTAVNEPGNARVPPWGLVSC